MPEIKDYEAKKHQAKKHTQKRRPHNEAEAVMSEADENIVEATEHTEEVVINTEAQNEGIHTEASHQETPHSEATHQEKEKIHLEFYGSELIRQKAPKVMELADTVAEEWIQDGKFEGLPVGNPLAQIAAAKALRTAKDVEKKLEEKGVFAMAKMGMEYVKSQIEKKKR